MSARLRPADTGDALRPAYVHAADPGALLAPDVLAVFGFGDFAPRAHADPRYLHVALQPAHADAPCEVWRADAPVQPFRAGPVAGARSSRVEFGWLDVEEDGDIAAAASRAYTVLVRHLEASGFPCLLRVWNYFDAINEGEGDAERYRQFCVGRATGLHGYALPLPAGTAIGRRDGRRALQVYWLAAREPGRPIENPRQVPAWDYPRQYGPRAPSFARAMVGAPALPLPLMLSGTAAVVGHASYHPDDIGAQLDETFRNFEALLGRARGEDPALPQTFGEGTLLKVYVRQPPDLARVETLLARHLDPAVPRLLLLADVCRRELLVEIDGFHA